MSSPPMTVSEIIDAFGGPTKFGEACGFARNPGARGTDMRRRGSIPSRHWPALIREAKRLGLPIDADVLMKSSDEPAAAGTALSAGGAQ